jgi:hypothetical protein
MISGSAGTVTSRRRAGPALRRAGRVMIQVGTRARVIIGTRARLARRARVMIGMIGTRARLARRARVMIGIIRVMIGTRARLARRQCHGQGPARRGRPGGGTAGDS